jgi:DNA repair photolyase
VAELERRQVEVRYVEQPCKSALNPVKGMGFKWSLNPYMGCEHRCAFCYVRAYEKRADRPSDDTYGRAIRIKTNVAEVLRWELSRPYVSSPVGIITRGPMIVRDADVLATLARRAELSITFSIPTLDEDVWRKTEPGTAHPRQRLRAIERLSAAGIRVGVGMAPILPGLSDRPEQLEAVVRAARDAGASHVWSGVLHLRDGTRQHFLNVLERHWPELLPRYLADYRTGPYLKPEKTTPVTRSVSGMVERLGMGGRPRHLLSPPPAPPEPQQLTLLAG